MGLTFWNKLANPETQAQEVLYLLIKHDKLSRSDFMNKAMVLNAPANIMALRKIGVEINTLEEKTTNKFGRDVSYGVYELVDSSKAREIYKKMQKK